jgi:hypothetical protein
MYKRSILPQVGCCTLGGRSVLLWMGLILLGLTGCASVKIDSEKPLRPQTFEQAKQYLQNKPVMVEQLNYELNQAERHCYERFMVSDCVDSVRACSADYRRAHIEAEAAANDLIRKERLKQKQSQ